MKTGLIHHKEDFNNKSEFLKENRMRLMKEASSFTTILLWIRLKGFELVCLWNLDLRLATQVLHRNPISTQALHTNKYLNSVVKPRASQTFISFSGAANRIWDIFRR